MQQSFHFPCNYWHTEGRDLSEDLPTLLACLTWGRPSVAPCRISHRPVRNYFGQFYCRQEVLLGFTV